MTRMCSVTSTSGNRVTFCLDDVTAIIFRPGAPRTAKQENPPARLMISLRNGSTFGVRLPGDEDPEVFRQDLIDAWAPGSLIDKQV